MLIFRKCCCSDNVVQKMLLVSNVQKILLFSECCYLDNVVISECCY